jgi:hypothetical protein
MMQVCGHDAYRFGGADLLILPRRPMAGSMPAWASLSIPGTMRAPGSTVTGRPGAPYGARKSEVGTQQSYGSMPGLSGPVAVRR